MRNSMRFAVKHAFAGSVVIGGIVVLVGASYFALLVWSVLAGLPLGGPLAFPFMVLFALVASVVAVLVVLLPVTVLAELVCSRHLSWPAAMQIPVATVMLVVQVFAIAAIIGALGEAPLQQSMLAGAIVSGVLLVPLGAYWWSLQSTEWLLRLATRSWSSGRQGHARQDTHDH